MVGFWIFAIVLLICVTIVICVFLNNAENICIYDVDKRLSKIDKRLTYIEDVLSKQQEGDKDNGKTK